jgi:uncharacterized protein (DUF305 family)
MSLMTTEEGRESRRPWLTVVVALLSAVALLALGTVIGTTAVDSRGNAASAAPRPSAVDVGFSRDMRDHHAQAVEMSLMVRDATDDPEIRRLALDVMLTQQQQLGQMYGWLASWGETQTSSGAPMSWMTGGSDSGMSGGGMAGMKHDSQSQPMQGAGMPGMATPQEMRRLKSARGLEAERLYLQLMIPHHRAAVAMAQAAAESASQPYVRRLAQSIVNSQTSELDVLRSLLAARGGPLPNS